jgi:hypothetical protein
MIVRKMRAAAIATALGALAILAWGMLFWGVLYDSVGVIKPGTLDPIIVDALEVSGIPTGTYVHPWPRDTVEAKRAWVTEHAEGPFFRLSYVREGVDPNSIRKLVFGVLHNSIVAAMATGLILLAGRGMGTFGSRFMLVTLAGLMGTVLIQAGDAVWFHMPMDYVLGAMLYQIVSWLLLAFILSAYLTSTRLAGE